MEHLNAEEARAALASCLPAGISYDVMPSGPDLGWRAREIAEFQEQRLVEAGYTLVRAEASR